MAQKFDLSSYKEMFRFDPEGFESLLQARAHRAVSTYITPKGQPVVCVQNRKLHSGRDPEAEAKRFVRTVSLDGKSTILLFGYASGYVAHAFEQRQVGKVIVFEPSISILLESLTHLPPNAEIQIITSQDALNQYLQSTQVLQPELCLTVWPASARIQTVAFDEARQTVLNCINQAHLCHNTRSIRSKGWLENYLRNLSQFADNPNLAAYKNKFAGYPAVICSAGPSLSRNAHLLKQLQGRCLIIAVNTAAKALAALGVQAHIIVSIESLNITSQLQDISWLSECTAFLDVTGGRSVFDLPFRATVPTSVECGPTSAFSNKLIPDQTFSSGYCVAHTALVIATKLGCNGIVLIGQNLAYEDGRAYAEGTVFESMRVTTKNGRKAYSNCEARDQINQSSEQVLKGKVTSKVGARATTMPAWGNPNETVDTSLDYVIFATWFAEASPKLAAQGIWHVNATEGGAHIENWEERTLADTIKHYKLDQPPAAPEEDVGQLLLKLGSSPGIGAECIIEALAEEKRKTTKVLEAVRKLRTWVNNDPDGDIRLSPEGSAKVFETWEALRTEIAACPLLGAQITSPLQTMIERQELNTFSLSQTLESEILELIPSIDAVLEELQSKVPRFRAAS